MPVHGFSYTGLPGDPGLGPLDAAVYRGTGSKDLDDYLSSDRHDALRAKKE